MRQFGLVGKSLTHSFSKIYFEKKFLAENVVDAEYSLFELESLSELDKFLNEHPGLQGFNVTMPYKKTIIPYLNELSDEAEEIGAVNVVSVEKEGGRIYLSGHNTDWYGFLKPISKRSFRSAIILGTGGASAAVQYALKSIGCDFVITSRDCSKGLIYRDLSESLFEKSDLIVNCTPLGICPNFEQKPPIPYDFISQSHFLYDLVYNPEITAFLREGAERGAEILNGMPMLIAQAEAAWNVWNR